MHRQHRISQTGSTAHRKLEQIAPRVSYSSASGACDLRVFPALGEHRRDVHALSRTPHVSALPP
eukprot:3069128-Rhodomonas_salina.1